MRKYWPSESLDYLLKPAVGMLVRQNISIFPSFPLFHSMNTSHTSGLPPGDEVRRTAPLHTLEQRALGGKKEGRQAKARSWCNVLKGPNMEIGPAIRHLHVFEQVSRSSILRVTAQVKVMLIPPFRVWVGMGGVVLCRIAQPGRCGTRLLAVPRLLAPDLRPTLLAHHGQETKAPGFLSQTALA